MAKLRVVDNDDEKEKLRVVNSKPQNISLRRVAEPKSAQKLRTQLKTPQQQPQRLVVKKPQVNQFVRIARPETRQQIKPQQKPDLRLGIDRVRPAITKQPEVGKVTKPATGRPSAVTEEAKGFVDVFKTVAKNIGGKSADDNEKIRQQIAKSVADTNTAAAQVVQGVKSGQIPLQRGIETLKALERQSTEQQARLQQFEERTSVGKTLGSVGTAVGQGLARIPLQLSKEIAIAVSGGDPGKIRDLQFEQGSIPAKIFGSEDIQSYTQEIAGRNPDATTSSIALASLLYLAADTLDITGGTKAFGISDDIAAGLVRAGGADDVVRLLNDLDIDPLAVGKYVDELVAATDEIQVRTLVDELLAENILISTAKLADDANDLKNLVNKQKTVIKKTGSKEAADQIIKRIDRKTKELGGAKKIFEDVKTKTPDEVAEATKLPGAEAATQLARETGEELAQKADEIPEGQITAAPDTPEAGTVPQTVSGEGLPAAAADEFKFGEPGQRAETAPSTRRVLGQEKPAVVSKREDVLLRDRLRSEKRGAEAGFKAGKRGGIQTTRQKVATRDARRKLVAQVKREIKQSKAKSISGRKTGKFTAEIQKQLDKIGEYSNLRWRDAQSRMYELVEENSEYLAKRGELPPEAAIERDLLRFAGLGQMDEAQLTQAIQEIQYLKQTGRTIRQEAARTDKLRIDNIKQQVIDSVSGGGGKPAPGERLDRAGVIQALSSVDDSMHGLDTLLRKMSRKDVTTEGFEAPLNKLANGVHRARNQRYLYKNVLSNLHQNAFNKIFDLGEGVKRNSNARRVLRRMSQEQDLGTFKNLDGQNVNLKMSQAEAYPLWQKFQDPTLNDTITEGMRFSDEMKQAITDLLDDDVRTYAQWQIDEYYPAVYQMINQQYRKKFGVDLPTVDKYSPVIRDVDSIEDSFSILANETQQLRGTTKPGALKQRTGSKAPLQLVDGNRLLLNHTEQMVHYAAFDDIVSDMRRVLVDPDVRKTIQKNNSRHALKQLDKHIEEIALNGSRATTGVRWLDRGFNKIRTGFTRGVTGLNAPVFYKQLTSIPATLLDPSTDFRSFMRGMSEFRKNPVKNSQFLYDNSPMLQKRYREGFDQNTVDALRNSKATAVTGTDTLLNKTMATVRAGDAGGLLPGMWGNYSAEFKRLVDNGVDEATATRKAIEKAERVAQRTQQASSIEALSPLQRSNPFVKLWTTFRNSPNQYYRLVSNAVTDLKYGRGDRAKNLRAIAVGWFVLPSVFQYVSDGFELEPENQARALLTGPLNGLFILGDFAQYGVSKVTGAETFGGPVEAPGAIEKVGEIWEELGDVIAELEDMSADDMGEAMVELVADVGTLLGVPSEPVMRHATGVVDAFDSERPTEERVKRALGFSEYTASGNKTKAEREETDLDKLVEENKTPKFGKKQLLESLNEEVRKIMLEGDGSIRSETDLAIIKEQRPELAQTIDDTLEMIEIFNRFDDKKLTDIPEELDPHSKNILKAQAVTNDEPFRKGKQTGVDPLVDWFDEQFSKETGFVPLRNNDVAIAMADYNRKVLERDLKDGDNELIGLQKQMVRQVIDRTYADQIGDIKGLSDSEIKAAYERGDVTDEQLQALFSAADYKYLLGANSSNKHKKLRSDLGFGYIGGSGTSGSGSGRISLRPKIVKPTIRDLAPRIRITPSKQVKISDKFLPGGPQSTARIQLER